MANILFYSAGRRIEMARRFKDRGHNVVFAELTDECPAAEAGFKVIHPVGYGYEEISKLCKENNIQLVIPFSCKGASDLSYSAMYGDAQFVGATTAANYCCYNKKSFAEAVLRAYPDYYPQPIKGYPKIWKPDHGNSSKGVMLAYDGIPCPIGFIEQDRLIGTERTVDSYISRTGLYMGGVCRVRERVAGGEVLDSYTENNPLLVEMSKDIGLLLGLRGPYCVQFMQNQKGDWKVIEANARFGGGYTLSLQAGLPAIRWIEQEYLEGKTIIGKDKWEFTVADTYRMRRSYRDHFFAGSGN